jgi:hypothetical protein
LRSGQVPGLPQDHRADHQDPERGQPHRPPHPHGRLRLRRDHMYNSGCRASGPCSPATPS